MTKVARSADGQVHHFPDNTPDAVIDRVMKDYARRNLPATRGLGRTMATEITQGLNEFNRSIPLFDETAAAIEAGVNTAKQAFRGERVNAGTLRGAFGRAREQQSAMSQDLNVRRPIVASSARAVGAIAPAFIPGGQAQAARGVAANIGRAAAPVTRNALLARAVNSPGARIAATSAASGAVNRLASEGSVSERLRAAANPASIAADVGLGYGIGRVFGGSGLPASQRRRVSPEVQTLAREGVDMTPGQMLGGAMRKIEEAATSMPLAGAQVLKAREGTMNSFTRAATRRALEPIGQRLPENVQTGSDATAFAAEQFSNRYNDIVPNVGLNRRDQQLAGELAAIQQNTGIMTPEARDQLNNIISQRIASRVKGGQLTGEEFKRVQSEIKELAGRFTKDPNVNTQQIGSSLNDIQASMEAALARQNPEYAAALAATNKGYSRLATLESAGSAAGVIGGIPTPKQLRAAYRAGDKSVRRRATAQGRRADQEFYDAGASVLPSSTPTSGTVERLAGNPLALAGMVTGGAMKGALIPVMAGTTGAVAAAYSKPALAIYNRILRSNVAKRDAEILLEQLRGEVATNPANRALLNDALKRLGYVAGSSSAALAQASPARATR